MTAPEMRTITIGGLGNICTVSGRGQAAVLLHGSAGAKSQWTRLARLLEDRFQVFAPDLLGHGGTEPWRGLSPLSLGDEAMVIAALVRHVGQRVHLVGHSYGGAVALHFAQSYPELLHSLVLIEPVAFHLLHFAGEKRARLLAAIESVATPLAEAANDHEGDETRRRAMARFVDFWNGKGSWAAMSEERRLATEAKARAVAAHFAATLGDRTSPTSYGRIATPALVIYGAKTPEPTRIIAESLVGLLPNARAFRVDGAGHMAPLTHAEIVNNAVAGHLNGAVLLGARGRRGAA
ncbi:MAG: alpha/beta hydrolase [Alphaproteobacteria bacterium]|nr:alpha/beta hydrolase [Alphaproteobacteria bacterium]